VFTTKNKSEAYIISDAIDFLHLRGYLHVLTPMSGAFFLVNTTISSVNVRVFSPAFPPSLENWSLSFWLPCLDLLWLATNPFTVPRAFLFWESCPSKQYTVQEIKQNHLHRENWTEHQNKITISITYYLPVFSHAEHVMAGSEVVLDCYLDLNLVNLSDL